MILDEVGFAQGVGIFIVGIPDVSAFGRLQGFGVGEAADEPGVDLDVLIQIPIRTAQQGEEADAEGQDQSQEQGEEGLEGGAPQPLAHIAQGMTQGGIGMVNRFRESRQVGSDQGPRGLRRKRRAFPGRISVGIPLKKRQGRLFCHPAQGRQRQAQQQQEAAPEARRQDAAGDGGVHGEAQYGKLRRVRLRRPVAETSNRSC